MKLKKNPNNDLNNNRKLFFSTGLMLVLSLTYVALEWKTYDHQECYCLDGMNFEDDLAEEATLINLPKILPPEPPVIPEIIEIIEDIEKEEESIFESTETNQEEEILEVEDVIVAEETDDIEIAMPAVQEKPIFPGCENEKDKLACFQTNIQKHIRKNFRYPEDEMGLDISGKIFVMFTIQKDGSIGNIRMRGPTTNLEKEAGRVIKILPKMKPGKQDGKAVRVPFSIPINVTLK